MKRIDSLKNTELKLICALMKNSRKSDRELGKAIGVSQPTVSRVIRRLEKERMIKEYTMIPDFFKLGFEIMAITFSRFQKGVSELSKEEFDKFRTRCRELQEKTEPEAIFMAMNGIGLGYDRVFISFHKDYSSFVKVINEVKKIPEIDSPRTESFMIDLSDQEHFQPLTLSAIANYLMNTKEEQS